MKLICLGDSLTFGYGVERGACWTTLFARRSGWEVVNLGISGDTTGGMLARLRHDVLDPVDRERSVRADCRVLVMGGSNDIFFSGSDSQARADMTAICHQLTAAGLSVLVGVPLPVDWTHAPEKWADLVDFHQASLRMAVYGGWIRGFAACFGLPAVDFAADFLNASGQVRRELLLDGIHPNGEGHRKMAERLSSVLLS